jgi:hypothetical protein
MSLDERPTGSKLDDSHLRKSRAYPDAASKQRFERWIRWIKSRHTRDIVLLASAITIILISSCILASIFWLKSQIHSDYLPVIAPAAAAVIATIAWAYRTANQRLAVVDSIASNIFSILRLSVSLFVVQNLILRYRGERVSADTYFISREEYNPMKAINFNELGFLTQDAIKRISGFYITLRAYKAAPFP